MAHLEFVNKTMTTAFNEATELLPLPSTGPDNSRADVDKQLAAGRGEYVEGISDPADPKWDSAHRQATTTHEENLQRASEEGARQRAEAVTKKPEVENLGGGVFSIGGLLNQNTSPEEEKQEAETTSNVQVQDNIGNEEQADDALLSGKEVVRSDKGDAGAGEETTAVEQSAAAILAASAPNLASKVVDDVNHSVPEAQQSTPETQHSEPEQTCVRLKVSRSTETRCLRFTAPRLMTSSCSASLIPPGCVPSGKRWCSRFITASRRSLSTATRMTTATRDMTESFRNN